MEVIKKAIEHLILYNPFFAYLALQIKFEREDEVGTASIDGITFRYNKDWIEQNGHRYCANVIAHGMSHVLLLHPLRAEGKKVEKWNQATDYAVNQILIKSGIGLINTLIEDKFEGLDAERIYELLKDESNDDSGNDSSPFDACSDGTSYKSTDGSDVCKVVMPPASMASNELEAAVTQKILDAATQADICGSKGFDAINQVIDGLKEHKKDWREILHKFTAELARNDYDWQKPDESYLQRNLYIPGLHNEEIGNIIFAIDTSKSTARFLGAFLSELKEALTNVTEELTVIHCDMQVRKVEQVQTEDVDTIKPEGGWGTSFIPVFYYIKEQENVPKALIYFTDGECYDSLTEPDYPVIWCICNNSNFTAPFGETIFIDN